MHELKIASPPSHSKASRTLKIENLGDPFRGGQVSGIRLKGRWLIEAGFPAGLRAAVTMVSPGVLELRVIGESQNDGAPVGEAGTEGRHVPSPDVPFDFWVSGHGSVSLFHPQTHKARAWLKAHCPAGDEHQYWCGAVAVEARFVGDLLRHAQADGLVISE